MFLLKWMILLQFERNLRAPRGGSEVSQTSLVWEWELRRGNGFPVSSSALGGWDGNRGKTKGWAGPGNGRSPWAKLHYHCSSGWWPGVLVAPGGISTMSPVPSHHHSHPAMLTSSRAHIQLCSLHLHQVSARSSFSFAFISVWLCYPGTVVNQTKGVHTRLLYQLGL